MKKLFFLAVLCNAFFIKAQWSLTGNSGTNPTTNFIGTTDNKDLVFKTNNTNKLILDKDGRFAIGGFYDNDVFTRFTANGRSLFIVGEDLKAFTIFDQPNDYTHFRVDTDLNNIFLQEDAGYTIIGSNVIPSCLDCNQYKLFVKNGIRTEKVKVDIGASNGWADYVFKKDYKLMPLKDLETFINTNGHLPEVPTTEQAIADGIELKEMNILLLKKVEELTLYTLQQQKQIEEQNKIQREQNKRIESLENKIKSSK